MQPNLPMPLPKSTPPISMTTITETKAWLESIGRARTWGWANQRQRSRYQQLATWDRLRQADPDKFLKVIKARPRGPVTERGNQLFLSRYMGGIGVWSQWLRYECPSTGQVYVKGVPLFSWGSLTHADTAQAWKFGLNKDEYLSLIKET